MVWSEAIYKLPCGCKILWNFTLSWMNTYSLNIWKPCMNNNNYQPCKIFIWIRHFIIPLYSKEVLCWFAGQLFPCASCDKLYQSLHSLRRHQLYECNKDPMFQCTFCPKRCKLKSNLNKHVHNMHFNVLEHSKTN